jgi:hypothetical protein
MDTWDQAARAATAAMQSQEVVFVLFEHYRRLQQADRHIVNGIISQQVLSEDESIRFDAVALVEQFRITCGVDRLRELMARLEKDDSSGAPFEWAKVNRAIGNLMMPRRESAGSALLPIFQLRRR